MSGMPESYDGMPESYAYADGTSQCTALLVSISLGELDVHWIHQNFMSRQALEARRCTLALDITTVLEGCHTLASQRHVGVAATA